MPDPIFPAHLAKLQDAKYFKIASEDNAVKGETEGGYVAARPRHTRRPRRTFITGFTDIKHAEYLEIQTFFDQVGTWRVFDYVDPTTLVTHKVRFEKPIECKYTGMGIAKLWTLAEVTLKEA